MRISFDPGSQVLVMTLAPGSHYLAQDVGLLMHLINIIAPLNHRSHAEVLAKVKVTTFPKVFNNLPSIVGFVPSMFDQQDVLFMGYVNHFRKYLQKMQSEGAGIKELIGLENKLRCWKKITSKGCILN